MDVWQQQLTTLMQLLTTAGRAFGATALHALHSTAGPAQQACTWEVASADGEGVWPFPQAGLGALAGLRAEAWEAEARAEVVGMGLAGVGGGRGEVAVGGGVAGKGRVVEGRVTAVVARGWVAAAARVARTAVGNKGAMDSMALWLRHSLGHYLCAAQGLVHVRAACACILDSPHRWKRPPSWPRCPARCTGMRSNEM